MVCRPLGWLSSMQFLLHDCLQSQGVAYAMQGMFWVLILTVLLLYICAIMATGQTMMTAKSDTWSRALNMSADTEAVMLIEKGQLVMLGVDFVRHHITMVALDFETCSQADVLRRRATSRNQRHFFRSLRINVRTFSGDERCL